MPRMRPILDRFILVKATISTNRDPKAPKDQGIPLILHGLAVYHLSKNHQSAPEYAGIGQKSRNNHMKRASISYHKRS